jgi:hypothetical protein
MRSNSGDEWGFASDGAVLLLLLLLLLLVGLQSVLDELEVPHRWPAARPERGVYCSRTLNMRRCVTPSYPGRGGHHAVRQVGRRAGWMGDGQGQR